MLTRQVTFGAQRLRIAPLTFEQVEEFCSEDPGRESCLRTIACAIGNAGGGQPTPAELKAVLTLNAYRALYVAVLEMSGLKSKTGEAAAEQSQSPVDFDGLRCFLASAVHWTFAECGRTPFPFVLKFLDHCQEFPPVHLLLRGFVGYKPPLRFNRDGDGSSEEEKRLLVGMWGGNVLPMSQLPSQLQLALARLPAESGTEPKP
jgi:hypothetical protein